MASIAILVTDNENGLISNSFNFTEVEIKRIRDALAAVYRPQLEHPPEPNENNQFVPVPYAPTPQEIFNLLSQSLVASVLNTCYDAELDQAIDNFKKTIPPFELRGS